MVCRRVTDCFASFFRVAHLRCVRPLADMRKYLFPFLLGFIAASLLFVFVILPDHGRAQFEQGKNTGAIKTKFEIFDKVRTELGHDYKYDMDGPSKKLFEVKDCAVMVVERNGVKTIRSSP